MKAHIFSLALFSFVLFSCGNIVKKEVSKANDQAAKVEFASLAANPDQYVGKNITIEGKVVHVCTETGKKMFIVGENPDVKLFVAAGENISKFPMELLGANIAVEGLITKPATASMTEKKEMESMGMAEGAPCKMNSDSCETEKTVAAQSTLADIVMEYKSHTVK